MKTSATAFTPFYHGDYSYLTRQGRLINSPTPTSPTKYVRVLVGSSYKLEGTTFVNNDAWHFVVVTRTAVKSLFVDGLSIAPQTFSKLKPSVGNANSVYINENWDNARIGRRFS